jgi:hypothetical protein
MSGEMSIEAEVNGQRPSLKCDLAYGFNRFARKRRFIALRRR